jgi:predicted regulator of Ras-like GTPase activity (Roadblock/LC7/MglB family)
MYEDDLRKISEVCERLQRDSNARAVVCIDKNGQEISATGEVAELDVTSLASLTAGSVAATAAISAILKEKEFSGQFYEGERVNVLHCTVGGRVIVVVIFDERSSLGLVRLRIKKASTELTGILEVVNQRNKANPTSAMLADITDEDIENLFND